MEVIYGKEAREKVTKALNIAYNSVAHTLGPKGSNAVAIIDGKTTITNDGVSIIKQLKLDDEIMNIPLNIIKEACFNTENKSGDGTTSAIVLTKAIYNLGIKLIEEGKNPITIRENILKEYSDYEKLILSYKKTVSSSKEIQGVATVSSGGNKEIGSKIAQAFARVNFKGMVDYKIDSSIEGIEVDYMHGYKIPSTYVGIEPIEQKEINNAKIIIFEGTISTKADIKSLAVFNREDNLQPLIVISNFEKDALEGIYLYNNAGCRIYPFSLPAFGIEREHTLEEIRLISKSPYLDSELNFTKFDEEDLKIAYGVIEKCVIKNNNILVKDVYEETYPDLFKRMVLKNRSKKEEVTNGVAIIRVGGRTEVEAEETLLRVQDAVNSTRLAINNGIVISGANIMYKLSEKLEESYSLRNVLKEPLKLILENSGYSNFETELNEVANSDINIGINAEIGKVENLMETGIIDPVETVINSLKSAVSIATSLLTINCIIKEGGNKKW